MKAWMWIVGGIGTVMIVQRIITKYGLLDTVVAVFVVLSLGLLGLLGLRCING